MLLAALMVLSACGGGNDSNSSSGSNNSNTSSGNQSSGSGTAAPSTDDTSTVARPGGDPIKDIVLWQTQSNELENTLMVHSEGAKDLDVLANVWSPLLELDPHVQLQPAVAKEWGSEDDGKTWTFKLRDDVTWVDVNGNYKANTTSLDWKVTLEWILNFHKNDAKNTTMLRNLVVGAEDYYNLTKDMDADAAKALTWESPEFAGVGIETPDDYTLIYHCVNECAYFPTLCTSAALYAFPAGMLDELGVDNMVGVTTEQLWYNGPYILSEYVMNNSKTLTKNESYWDKDCSLFDSVTILMIEDTNMDDMYWESGEVDQTELASATSQTILDNPSDSRNELVVSTRMKKYSYQWLLNYAKNNADGTPDDNWNNAVANEAFRKALYYGIDYYNSFYRSNRLDPLHLENFCFTMKNFLSFSDGKDYTTRVMELLSDPIPESDGEHLRRFDPDKALAFKDQAMKELEGKVTFPVTIDHWVKAGSSLDGTYVLKECIENTLGTDFIVVNICEYINSNLEEVFNPSLHSWYSSGWGADYGDIENFHDQILYQVDGAYTTGRYTKINDMDPNANPEVTEQWQTFTDMALAAKQISDLDERYEAFAKAEAYLIDHALVIPYYYSNALQMTKINDYSKTYAYFGCQNSVYKNWETSTEPYTAEDYAFFQAEFENGN